MRGLCLLTFGLVLSLLAACSPPDERETVRLDLPDPVVCIRDYSPPGENDPATQVDNLLDATRRADTLEPDALICLLALYEGRGHHAEFETVYRYYRATGREPERLNSYLTDLDRVTLATDLRIFHNSSPELAPFKYDFFGCARYDDVATELLIRVEPGEHRRCLPPRWLWSDIVYFVLPR
jgi:hypothetical protein